MAEKIWEDMMVRDFRPKSSGRSHNQSQRTTSKKGIAVVVETTDGKRLEYDSLKAAAHGMNYTYQHMHNIFHNRVVDPPFKIARKTSKPTIPVIVVMKDGTTKEYQSIKDAERAMGVSTGYISHILSGRRNSRTFDVFINIMEHKK